MVFESSLGEVRNEAAASWSVGVMQILTTLIIGLVVGIVAKFLMPGKDPGGFIITTILGIAGAFLARWIGVKAGWYAETDAAGFIASVVGAMVLLLLYRVLFRPRGAGSSH